MLERLKRNILYILHYLTRKGLLIFHDSAFVYKEVKETIYNIEYNSTYYKIINPQLIDISYYNYLDKSFKFTDNVFCLDQCFVEKESGGVVKGHKIVKNSFLNCWGYIYKSGIFKHLFFLKSSLIKNKKIEKGFLLTGNMSDNFFHFLIDSLPRILVYLELRKKIPDLFLLVNYRKSFTEQYLCLLKILPNEVFWLKENIWVKELYYTNNKFAQNNPNSKWPNFIYSKTHLNNLAQVCLNSALSNNNYKNFPEYIYISRAIVGTRILQNENDFMALIEPYGIERVYLEDLSVAEQILLMSNAKVIIAVHGAGLANLIYVKNALIIEFFPFNKKLSTLYQMHQLGQLGSNKHVLYVLNDVSEEQDFVLGLERFESFLKEEIRLHHKN